MITRENYKQFIDKYFLRAREILKAEGLNPWIRAQVFIRKGPGKVAGVDEALEIINGCSDLVETPKSLHATSSLKRGVSLDFGSAQEPEHAPDFSPRVLDNGGRVFSLNEGDVYEPAETLMVLEGRADDLIDLETIYLGVLSAETTKANDGHGVDTDSVRKNMAEVVEAAEGRPVSYFGARHWRYDEDAAITRAAFEGGATSASTDAGAATFGGVGMGTIPHALENVMAAKYGYENAVVESTKAFDRQMDKKIPRIALVDYANKEITDSLATARALNGNLYGVRVDTCGENIPEEGVDGDRKYWEGRGVTVTGVYALRKALNKDGFEDVKMFLSSGFGKPEKVRAFVDAEKELGMKLFDALGVGGVFESRMATADIVGVGEFESSLREMAKVGRAYRPNPRLELRLGGGR